MAALLAGVAAVVYVTGAIVLSLRLEFEHLPWTNVVSQLPRELVISIGAGQVLLPALLVGALYGLYRVICEGPTEPPKVHRLRDGFLPALPAYAVTLLALVVPVGAVLLLRKIFGHFDPHTGRIIGLCLGVLLAAPIAVAVQEIRALVIDRRSMAKWSNFRVGATMAGFYSAMAIPAIVAAAAAIPLSEAKVCTTANYAVEGTLVGEASDRVYVGEQGLTPRRIVVFPLSKVGKMFIGEKAATESCAVPTAPVPSVAGSGS
jgi:hypothetical protein